jgi:hypothetical protein
VQDDRHAVFGHPEIRLDAFGTVLGRQVVRREGMIRRQPRCSPVANSQDRSPARSAPAARTVPDTQKTVTTSEPTKTARVLERRIAASVRWLCCFIRPRATHAGRGLKQRVPSRPVPPPAPQAKVRPSDRPYPASAEPPRR